MDLHDLEQVVVLVGPEWEVVVGLVVEADGDRLNDFVLKEFRSSRHQHPLRSQDSSHGIDGIVDFDAVHSHVLGQP